MCRNLPPGRNTEIGQCKQQEQKLGETEQGTLREMIVSRPASPPYPVWPCGCHGLWLSVLKMRYLGTGPCLNVGDQPWGLLPAVLRGTRCSLSPRRGSAGGTRAFWVVLGSWAPCCHCGRWQHPPASSTKPSARCHQARCAARVPGTPRGTAPSFAPTRGNAPGPTRKDGAGTGCPGTRSRHATLGTMPRTSSSQSCDLTTRSCFLLKFCTSTSVTQILSVAAMARSPLGRRGASSPVPVPWVQRPVQAAARSGECSPLPSAPRDAAQHPARLSSTLCQQEPLQRRLFN